MRRSPSLNSSVTNAEWPDLDVIMFNSRDELYKRAEQYCKRRDILLASDSTFGFGVHGTVFGALREPAGVKTALKIHEREIPYYRERDVYFRLRDLAIREIEGHHIPLLIDFDDELFAIEMSVVVRPFVLDFGGAYLDHPPDYDAEILDQWARDKEEQFEVNWPRALRILAELRRYGIYVVDVNPGNIGFVYEENES